MKSPAVSAKKRHGGGAGFALGCGCKDAKSVSVSASPFLSATTGTSTTTGTRRGGTWRNPSASTTTDTLTLTSASSCSLWEDAVAELGYKDGGCRLQESSVPTPSFSGLLRELSELEQSVASWGRKGHHHEEKHSPSPPPMQQEHRRAKGDFRSAKEDRFGVDGDGGVGLDGSVAVVKQSDDPLGDFRRSMLQMIVENGIVAGEDLREMLRRFLTLNAPHHHDAILRAFAEIWDDVFAAASHDATPSRAPVSRREPGRPPVPRTPPPLATGMARVRRTRRICTLSLLPGNLRYLEPQHTMSDYQFISFHFRAKKSTKICLLCVPVNMLDPVLFVELIMTRPGQ